MCIYMPALCAPDFTVNQQDILYILCLNSKAGESLGLLCLCSLLSCCWCQLAIWIHFHTEPAQSMWGCACTSSDKVCVYLLGKMTLNLILSLCKINSPATGWGAHPDTKTHPLLRPYTKNIGPVLALQMLQSFLVLRCISDLTKWGDTEWCPGTVRVEVEGATTTSYGRLNKPDTRRPTSLLELLCFKLSSQKDLEHLKSIFTAPSQEKWVKVYVSGKGWKGYRGQTQRTPVQIASISAVQQLADSSQAFCSSLFYSRMLLTEPRYNSFFYIWAMSLLLGSNSLATCHRGSALKMCM